MTTTKSRRAGGKAKRTITVDELGKVQFKADHVDAERISSEETWLGTRATADGQPLRMEAIAS